MTTKVSLESWLEKIDRAGTYEELAKLLDEFRVFPWTDLERQRVAHCYMERLDVLDRSQPKEKKSQQAVGNDGPVWYEKM